MAVWNITGKEKKEFSDKIVTYIIIYISNGYLTFGSRRKPCSITGSNPSWQSGLWAVLSVCVFDSEADWDLFGACIGMAYSMDKAPVEG